MGGSIAKREEGPETPQRQQTVIETQDGTLDHVDVRQ